jgi:succinoglycan biosynthesis transport protein ExoP
MMSKNFELLRSAGNRELPKSALGAITNGDRMPPARPFDVQPSQGEGDEWLRALQAVQRHWRWSLAFASGVSFCVALTVLLMKPVYEPTARIEVDPPGNELFSLERGLGSDSIAYAETQAKSLETDQLAVVVIRKLHLERSLELVSAQSKLSESDREPVDPNSEGLHLMPAEHDALKVFRRSLQVKRDPSSWLINVSFAAHDPNLAALVTNTVVEQFIETSYQTRHDAIVQSTQWLAHQLDDIRSRTEQSNRALADFQKSSGITPVGNAQSTFGEKMSELNRQLTVAQADRIQLEALLKKVTAANHDSLPQLKADSVVQELSKKLAGAHTDLNRTLVIYGRNHPKTKELQAEINELQSQLKAQEESVFSNLNTSYAAAHVRENLLNSELKNAAKELGQMAQYEALKKEAEANEALYNALYTKVKEAGISAESKSSNIRWVDRARVLDTPTRPRRVRDIALGMLAGIVGGILLAFIREGLDNKIRTVDDVKTLTGLSSVSLVPMIGAIKGELKESPHWTASLNSNGDSPEVFLLERPSSAEAEALRGLFTSVCLSRSNRASKVLLVASAMASEGKTTIAINLSVALARHASTCIVDADLRKARVANIFGLESRHGLSDVLNRSCTLEEALVLAPGVPNLMLLSCGSIQENAGELICSVSMGDVLRQLRQHFQFVVVDSSPILPYADARAISTLADGVIFVGRFGVSTREAIKRSLELLEQVQSAPVLEVVLNAVDFNSSEYQYDYGHAYKYK